MDIILIIKAFLIGLVWVGSFYLVISYVFPIFPMPALLNMREQVRIWCDDLATRNEKRGRRLWNLSKALFKIITAILWTATVAAFAYLLIPVLENYIPNQNDLFWAYYGISITLPAFLLVWRGIKIYTNVKNKSLPGTLGEDDKDLSERLHLLK
jgi:hypothetical protein